MNLSRKSFLGSVVALFSAKPLLTEKKKVKESFSIDIEEIGSNRFRATLRTTSLLPNKVAVIESLKFTPDRPENPWAQTARIKFLFDINRAVGIHLFPKDNHVWNEWNLEGPYPELNKSHNPVRMKWPPSTISDDLDPHWSQNHNNYLESRAWEKASITERFQTHLTNFFRKNPKV